MNCRQARQYLQPYLDSELEASVTVRVNEHLASCASCSQRFRGERRIEALVTAHLQRGETGDDETARGVLDGVLRPPAHKRVPATAAAISLGLLALIITLVRLDHTPPSAPTFVAAAAADHGKYLADRLRPDGPSDPDSLRQFLQEQLGIAPAGLPAEPQWSVRGRRLCHLGKVRVGLLMLERAGHRVSLFLLPTPADDDATHALHELALDDRPQSFDIPEANLVIAKTNGVVRCAVGDLPIDELMPLVQVPN